MGKAQLELLERDGSYISVPKGISMRPMITGGRDAVLIRKLTEPPKRYDLVLYLRSGLQGVIHRVIHVREGEYIICGDNCWQLERISPEQVTGIITEFCRKGRWHTVEELPYRLYVRLWTDLLFLRRPAFYIRDRLKYAVKKSHS